MRIPSYKSRDALPGGVRHSEQAGVVVSCLSWRSAGISMLNRGERTMPHIHNLCIILHLLACLDSRRGKMSTQEEEASHWGGIGLQLEEISVNTHHQLLQGWYTCCNTIHIFIPCPRDETGSSERVNQVNVPRRD